MTATALLTTVLPVRDPRDRTIAHELRTHPVPGREPANVDDEARAVLTMLQHRELLRMVRGLPLHVPITPAVLRGGAITGFASADLVFFLATSVLDDAETVRALERYAGKGFRFGFIGDRLTDRLPEALQGALVAVDLGARSGLALTNAVQRLLDAGARLIARQVDDRASRERLRASGVHAFTGCPLPAGRSAPTETRQRVLRALSLLTSLSDGRPPDATFDTYVASDPVVAESVFRATASAASGTVRPRTLSHAITLLGREAMLDRLLVATCFLLGECAGDPELGMIALRRGRSVARLATAVDRAGHPRACVLAGLLSVADVATGMPSGMLADELQMPAALRDALVARHGVLGTLLDAVEAHEYGWWDDAFVRCRTLGIAPEIVAAAWMEGWKQARAESSSRAAVDS